MIDPVTLPTQDTQQEEELQEPRWYRVLLHNDDYTTMDFVVHVLQSVFGKTEAEAYAIMMRVHKEGIGECGVYTAEIAETKVQLVHSLARRNSFPLRASMEEV
ncbi:ATP-dependent Clp protease adapter protein ClpS [Thermodesulfomicrobium sp. WS]|nr:ATP-dependent Clp protease adapter protein ClpS [Thermodesulfomicrobium sp. WS]